MLVFNKRKQLENKYLEWINENHIEDCAFNMVSFFAVIGVLDEQKAIEYLQREEEKDESNN
jgi:hypothetical protein